MQQANNDKDYIIINMSKVSHNSLKYKNYEYKPEIPIINDDDNNSSSSSNIKNNQYNFAISLSFTTIKNYLKSYFIKQQKLDEENNV